ncbi:MAG: aminopeptidase N [Alphaproteobacteria bacterium]|nr:aminopeptidase N [Alphaproteobacteria bacterium]
MSAEARTDSKFPQTVWLKDYRPPDWRIETVDLTFDLGEDATRVSARLAVRRSPEGGAGPLTLDGQDLKLLSVAIDGVPLGDEDYELGREHLTIAKPPQSFSLETVVEIRPQDNTALEGLFKSSGTFCTQCEAEGFRRITFFIDRPDVMATYRTTIIADRTRYPVLLSNGNLVESEELPDGRRRAAWEDPFPKPSYLFALVAGDLACVEDTYTTGSGRAVTLRICVEPGNEDRCDWAMQSLKNAMRWDEAVYGLEYDLDVYMIVAVGDFNMGAMENKGLNVFNSKYVLARPETATDSDYAFIESVIAHEYFHNWTGNRVTCRDWFQLSLKEGLTVFRDQQFSADMRSAAVKRIGDVRTLRARQFPEDAGPLAHPVRPDSYIEINNFYTATVYEKGAEVVRMIHTLLGPDGFRRGIDLYFERHDGQAVTCGDFVAAMEDATGTDLSRFRHWYAQAGTPKLKVEGRYDPANRLYEMTFHQSTPVTPGQDTKESLHIPVAVGLIDAAGRDMPLRLDGEDAANGGTKILELREPVQTFRFMDIAVPPTPSVLRNFSAPVIIEQNLTEDQRLHLMAHDSDPFNRWQAGQDIALQLLLSSVRAIQRGDAVPADEAFVAALGRTLEDEALDPAFAAEMLALPDEEVIADRMEVIDVDAVHQAREGLRRAIAQVLRDKLLTAYHRHAGNAPPAPAPEAAGHRALKNRALGYLVATGEVEMDNLCHTQFEASQTMSDAIAALSLLAHGDSPHRRRALAEFRQRWADDRLVLDKWFMVQATAPRTDTLKRVRELMRDSAFSMRNPNKVRALIGAFASANAVRFHAADGAGYRFLSDRVLELDPANPQIAARLLTPLGRWRRFDKARQKKIRTQLQRILAREGLSRDVYEIVKKTLG